jgi:hypothetical protein
MFPASTEGKAVLLHEFTGNCWLMDKTILWVMIVFIVWGLAFVLHFLWTWILYRSHSMYIQKLMIFIPIFFIIDNLVDYVYWKSCPWTKDGGENIRYLQIVQIAIVTVFNTFFVGLCTFLSKGWSLLRTQFTRNELSSMSMIVAIFYLVYSAYFIASDIKSLKLIIVIVLAAMHAWVILACSMNIKRNISMINSHIVQSAGDQTVLEALKLKRFILTSLWVIIVCFFLNKIMYSCLYMFVKNNYFSRNLYMANLVIELGLISLLMYFFRSRKWPDYFSVDM